MPIVKIPNSTYAKEIIYNDEHWNHLWDLRNRAFPIMEILSLNNLPTLLYGSTARGDIHLTSDVDILISRVVPTYRVNMLLQNLELLISEVCIIMATPNLSIKAVYKLSNETTLVVPLTELSVREEGFYNNGGSINFQDLKDKKRQSGVDKRLVHIRPTKSGHFEQSLLSKSDAELIKLNVNLIVFRERERVLLRRDRVGRTGVYLNYLVDLEIGIERTLEKLAVHDSIIRRKLRNS